MVSQAMHKPPTRNPSRAGASARVALQSEIAIHEPRTAGTVPVGNLAVALPVEDGIFLEKLRLLKRQLPTVHASAQAARRNREQERLRQTMKLESIPALAVAGGADGISGEMLQELKIVETDCACTRVVNPRLERLQGILTDAMPNDNTGRHRREQPRARAADFQEVFPGQVAMYARQRVVVLGNPRNGTANFEYPVLCRPYFVLAEQVIAGLIVVVNDQPEDVPLGHVFHVDAGNARCIPPAVWDGADNPTTWRHTQAIGPDFRVAEVFPPFASEIRGVGAVEIILKDQAPRTPTAASTIAHSIISWCSSTTGLRFSTSGPSRCGAQHLCGNQHQHSAGSPD